MNGAAESPPSTNAPSSSSSSSSEEEDLNLCRTGIIDVLYVETKVLDRIREALVAAQPRVRAAPHIEAPYIEALRTLRDTLAANQMVPRTLLNIVMRPITETVRLETHEFVYCEFNYSSSAIREQLTHLAHLLRTVVLAPSSSRITAFTRTTAGPQVVWLQIENTIRMIDTHHVMCGRMCAMLRIDAGPLAYLREDPTFVPRPVGASGAVDGTPL
jgi:hypothetical protein